MTGRARYGTGQLVGARNNRDDVERHVFVMSRPNVTDEIVDGLEFARACALDQRVASHARSDRSWDKRYAAALAAIDAITNAHKISQKKSRA